MSKTTGSVELLKLEELCAEFLHWTDSFVMVCSEDTDEHFIEVKSCSQVQLNLQCIHQEKKMV